MDQAFVPPWTKDLLHPGAGRRSLKSLQSLEEKLTGGGGGKGGWRPRGRAGWGTGVLSGCQAASGVRSSIDLHVYETPR